MSKQKGHGHSRSSGLPVLELVWWDVPPHERSDDGSPKVGARFEGMKGVTFWSEDIKDIAGFIGWFMEHIKRADDDRELAGSLQGAFDYAAMGMTIATLPDTGDNSLWVRIDGHFIGTVMVVETPDALLRVSGALLRAVLKNRERERKSLVN